MDKKAKVATPRLGQRSDGPFLASWVVSAHGPSAASMNPTVMMLKTHCCHSDTRVPHWLVTWCMKAQQNHLCKSRISYDSSHGVYEPKATSCPWLPQWEFPLNTNIAATTYTRWSPWCPIVTTAERVEQPVSCLRFSFQMSLSPQALGSRHSYSTVCTYSIRSPPFQMLTWTSATHPLEASAFEFKGVGEWQQN